jgi:hypothetical protein
VSLCTCNAFVALLYLGLQFGGVSTPLKLSSLVSGELVKKAESWAVPRPTKSESVL